MTALFSPFTLRGVTLPNRIVISPMCQYSAERGEATDWHMIHLGHLALSGAGLLCIEATAVEPDGRITAGDLGLWDDATEAALKPVLAAIRKHSPVRVAMQLSHAGRKASSEVPWKGGQLVSVADGGWLPHAPSALPHKDGETPPLALDAAGLNRIRDAFAAAAKRAARLGIDAIEVHAAHGYLLHQFLSPLANQRTDEYGGSRENRMRFPLEIFEIVRAAFPADRPVGVRVSATDWVEGGWELEDTIAFAHELKQRGCDWIDVSSGGVSPLQKIPLSPGYQVPFAQAVKRAVGMPTIAVGLINDPAHANRLIESGDADFVAMARAMLYDPRWPWHAAAELGAQVSAPPQYWRSQPREHKALFGDIAFGQR
ncbi:MULTISPECIES: NADH:flavin oxidoreductase/NADH oxidase [unclassified Burkholderia]|uniref:NADH:flavin oxidoreductase/NADH oxidase n=1 Tax=unclassified Burkholderia TaxID=2613784 RepID=UPI000F568DAB|nr:MULTISPECIES: NADH:flavin oxidoreductase/NADH oxidase [unclassified Burkholderia]RQR75865.1 NADH:flavin oxidoreductase/NADH oxidase [Burkholderia sp. Bp9015]RQR77445.1 NADH:flavin oxidoreductase/NADH oxidase [Burkholderia sp. Bp9011]RQR92692.1 NADH:flavin oxidoreductase/NADH oxidase [Burkholderia sp. Bp9010]RQR97439.1 NADH:flavin oxidoreductase/NADH oxidase [Burkholderia sp. Bp8994]RQS01567.1 NADH:flavin oxidoreductase/NADH oxidase [Burkholderia sp. Bp8991]